MSTENPLVVAARKVVEVWANAYNESVSHHDFECPELDQAMADLSTALAAPEPRGVEGAAVEMFVSPRGRRYLLAADRVFEWTGNAYQSTSLKLTAEFWEQMFPRDVHCSKEDTLNWIARHGAPEVGK